MNVREITLTSKADKLSVTPLGPGFCADITGFDFSHFDNSEVVSVRQALLEYGVLRFRGCEFTDQHHVEFSQTLGTVLPAPVEIGLDHSTAYPEILRVSNVVQDGRKIGELGSGDARWHTDMCYKSVPPSISLLHAIETPPSGGNTQFSNMYAAFEGLPEDLRAELEGKVVRLNATYNGGGYLRRGVAKPKSDDFRTWCGPAHPMIRTHPETGKRALYLGTRRQAFVVGLTPAKSEALLDTVWARIADPDFTWTQVWQTGDLVMWDNRCVMHRRDGFDPSARRLMHRTTIAGEMVMF